MVIYSSNRRIAFRRIYRGKRTQKEGNASTINVHKIQIFIKITRAVIIIFVAMLSCCNRKRYQIVVVKVEACSTLREVSGNICRFLKRHKQVRESFEKLFSFDRAVLVMNL